MTKIKKALEKATDIRKDYIQDPYERKMNAPDELTSPTLTIEEQPVKRGKPKARYQYTKIQPVDFQKLIQNRIIPDCRINDTSDQVKILRTQILENMRSEGKNTLLVTSANPGEGKTLTAINLAISFSQQLDCTVLLVDTDLRKPSISTLFDLDIKMGLSDYLRGKAEIPDLLINPGIPGLVILPGGRPLPNSSEFLGAPRMESLVEEMKDRYPDRFIIFDSSPLLTSADPLTFSRFIDGILIVVEAEKTKREDLKRSLALLRDRPVIGTVFNKIKD
ncbi:MAG TPA: polysaccharide biosynthesis tyrosine autokinase [Syntrophales bacterium]|nr:polysaccharide biosynthesis tyrosine autokinase [Syntrophales bacterium]